VARDDVEVAVAVQHVGAFAFATAAMRRSMVLRTVSPPARHARRIPAAASWSASPKTLATRIQGPGGSGCRAVP